MTYREKDKEKAANDYLNNNSIIFGYKKKDSNIEVKIRKGNSKSIVKIFDSEKNEQKILDEMDKQFKKFIDIAPDLENDRNIIKVWTTIMGIGSIILSIASIDKAINYEAYNQFLLLVKSSPFFLGTYLHYQGTSYKHVIDKMRLYYDNKEILNKEVKKNPTLINNINHKAKKRVDDYLEQDFDNPINIYSIDKMKLKELKRMVEQVKLQKEFNFETAQDVIDNHDGNINKLSKQYENISDNHIKKYLYKRTDS